MTKHRKSMQANVAVVTVDGASEEKHNDLNACLDEVLKLEGVLGYILKDDTTAKIDLTEPDKTVEYAVLASQAFDAANEMQALFNLGNIQDMAIECGILKVLCQVEDGVSVSVFLEKTADLTLVLTKLQSRNHV